jgi:hypothetical protein
MSEDCPFCQLSPERIIVGDDLCVVIRDAYPVSPGHTLIMPRRHVGSFFETSADERARLLGPSRPARWCALDTAGQGSVLEKVIWN